jgi:predicted transcriptional regulator
MYAKSYGVKHMPKKQYHKILKDLALNGPCESKLKLAERTGLNQSVVTRAINRLHKQGLVEIRKDWKGLRPRHVCSITLKGLIGLYHSSELAYNEIVRVFVKNVELINRTVEQATSGKIPLQELVALYDIANRLDPKTLAKYSDDIEKLGGAEFSQLLKDFGALVGEAARMLEHAATEFKQLKSSLEKV